MGNSTLPSVVATSSQPMPTREPTRSREKELIPFTATDPTGAPVLALAAHADDPTRGCGGTLARHASNGDPVKVVVVTIREPTNNGTIAHDEHESLREEEARRALAVLGITDVEFWRLEDRRLEAAPDLVARIQTLLASASFEVVYCPSPVETHTAHRTLAGALWEASCGLEYQGTLAFYELSVPFQSTWLV